MDIIRQYNNNVFSADKKLNEKKLYSKVYYWISTHNMGYYYPKGIVYTVTELLEDIIETDIIQLELDLSIFRLTKPKVGCGSSTAQSLTQKLIQS